MNDMKTTYNKDAPLPMTLQAFRNRPCTLPWTNENYQAPTPGEVSQLIKLAGWSQNDAAKIVGVSWHPKKGSSTIRKWKSEKSSSDAREIPYSAWRMLLLHSGIVTIDDAMKELDSFKNLK